MSLTFNEYNLAAAASVGVIKGFMHTLGRTVTGVYELLTFPVPTEPVAMPRFVWENLGTETRYFPIFNTKK
jgi:putative exosortase-associated protein (TIGR04073 family)